MKTLKVKNVIQLFFGCILAFGAIFPAFQWELTGQVVSKDSDFTFIGLILIISWIFWVALIITPVISYAINNWEKEIKF
ncbi:MAG: hypothetical protein ACUZ8H_01575 [Candidatus Anammoxibacter sp.]